MNDQPRAPVLTTAWVFGDGRIQKAESQSQRLAEDPFSYAGDGEGGLVPPLFNLDELAQLQTESNTLHYRCVKQKAADVCGRGFVIRPRDNEEGLPAEEERWHEFVESVEDDDRADETFKERITQAHEDYEGIGWGVLEVGRRGDGTIDGLWHVPAHTVRAHKDGRRYAQMRSGKTVWFKRFGVEGTVDRKTGAWSDRTQLGDFAGNELIVIRNYTPRSSFYGSPDHIPALSALAGWRAQAEFNVRFFDRNAVPAYAVVIEGADVSPELEEMIQQHFHALKGEPHKTLVLPVPRVMGDESAQVHVRFEKLAVDIKDASFRLYKQDNALEICIAHGVPPYRVGWPIMGSLGGATAEEMTQIYNDSIVQPRQETWEQRLTRRLLGRKGLEITTWLVKANELDTRNELRDLDKARLLYELNAATPNMLADFFGFPRRKRPDGTDDPLGDLYRDQLMGVEAVASLIRAGFDPAAALQAMGLPAMPHTGLVPVTVKPNELGGVVPLDTVFAKRWSEEVASLSELRQRVEQLLAAPERAAA